MLKPHLSEQWCVAPTADPAFVAAMEDILAVDERSYNAARPVVCLDETSRQLLGEVRPSQPLVPGRLTRHDPEYVRGGVVNLFLITEPLRGWRDVSVRQQRTRLDFAHCVRQLLDVHYPNAERVVLVLDQLNTHNAASLYAALPAREARRLVERLELHHTPKHGSWLNMAELELSVLARQCLAQRVPDRAAMARAVQGWAARRNAGITRIDWQFTTADARTRLHRLYPTFEM